MDVVELFRQHALHAIRPQWVPISTPLPQDQEDSPMLSKFGGTKPLLYGDHQWPRCGMCNRNMMFVMQIDERSLDSEMRNVIAPGDAEAKMFQFFLC